MKSIASLTAAQLRRAAEIKENIESLSHELNRIFVGSAAPAAATAAPQAARVKGNLSPAAKARISAKLKAVWARRKAAAAAAQASPAKGKMSPAAKAQLSAKLKAVWAKRKAAAAAPQASPGRRKMSPAAKAQLSAKLKAVWAKRKAAQKQ